MDRHGAGGIGLLWLVGAVLPLAWGFAPPVLAALGLAIGATALARRRPALDPRGVPAAIAIALLGGLASAVVLAATARGLAGVLAAFAAAWWAVPALVLGALALPRVPAATRPIAIVLLAVLVPLCGGLGARFEAAGPHARGWAHSGPILGVHPRQATAITIDGFGPFDIAFNDYVEPDGSRGYDPQAYADALQRALHAIARLHFAHGPARATEAFADARVELVTTAAVRERTDDAEARPDQPRLIVWSGTTGPRSRVRFTCPGKLDDPAGIDPDDVTAPMCPNKYASEGSAGLGLTGRWTGYVEGRGRARLSLASALRWTPSDDAIGRRVIEREGWILAGIAIAFALVLAWRWPGALEGLRRAGASSHAWIVVLAVGALAVGAGLRVAALELPHGDPSELTDPRTFTPALALVVVALSARGAVMPPLFGAVLLGLGTLALASHLGAAAFVWPDLGAQPLRDLVEGSADALAPYVPLPVLELEGAAAAVLVAALIGLAAHVVLGVRRSLPPARDDRSSRRWSVTTHVAVAALAGALVVSRKTAGGSALVPMAMATWIVLHTALCARGLRPGPAWALLLAAISLGAWVLWASFVRLPSHPFVTLCTAVGALALLAAPLVLLDRHPATPPSSPP